MDNMVRCYRIPFLIKKWWFPIYTWRVRMHQTGHKEQYLNFLCELCIGMLREHGSKPIRRRLIVGIAGETKFDNQGGH
jgi:hypothetical protein